MIVLLQVAQRAIASHLILDDLERPTRHAEPAMKRARMQAEPRGDVFDAAVLGGETPRGQPAHVSMERRRCNAQLRLDARRHGRVHTWIVLDDGRLEIALADSTPSARCSKRTGPPK